MTARLFFPSLSAPWFPLFFQSVERELNRIDARRTLDLAVVVKSAAYTVTRDDSLLLCDATAGAFTVTLPAAVGTPGRMLVIKRINAGANAVTIDGHGTETIDGATTKSLSSQWAVLTIVSDGANWLTI